MIPLSKYKNEKLGIFGLGKAGKAAVASALASSVEIYAWDDKSTDLTASQNLYITPIETWPWEALTALLLSPGVPLTHPTPHPVVNLAKQTGCPIIGEVELLQQHCPEATYIGITGTNGKSTTTALIGHILKESGKHVQIGGNLGTPSLALEPLGKDGIYVLELSSYQLDLVHTTRFQIACLLNISPDHLDRHGDMEGYIATKCHIFDRQQKTDIAILGTDEAITETLAREQITKQQAQVIPVSVTEKVTEGITVTGDGILTNANQNQINLLPCKTLQGTHNWQNAAVAYAATQAVGISPEAIEKAMQSFPGLAHRMEWLGEKDNVTYINDSKATNADSTAKALDTFDNIYWIAGGIAKAGGIESLKPYFPKITKAFLIGEAQETFAETLGKETPHECCDTLEQATQRAYEEAQLDNKPATILCSPAAASFDQWKNFEVRGDAFRAYVAEIITKHREAVS